MWTTAHADAAIALENHDENAHRGLGLGDDGATSRKVEDYAHYISAHQSPNGFLSGVLHDGQTASVG